MKRAVVLSFIALILGLAIFFGFKQLISSGFSEFEKELAAAFLGAVITVVITSVLLKVQTESEAEREKSVAVFNAKLDLYKEFTEFLFKVIKDGKFTEEEESEFSRWAMLLSLVAGMEVNTTISFFIAQSIEFRKFSWNSLSLEEKKRFVEWYNKVSNMDTECSEQKEECEDFVTVGEIILVLKKDLGEEIITKGSNLFSTLMVNKILDTLYMQR